MGFKISLGTARTIFAWWQCCSRIKKKNLYTVVTCPTWQDHSLSCLTKHIPQNFCKSCCLLPVIEDGKLWTKFFWSNLHLKGFHLRICESLFRKQWLRKAIYDQRLKDLRIQWPNLPKGQKFCSFKDNIMCRLHTNPSSNYDLVKENITFQLTQCKNFLNGLNSACLRKALCILGAARALLLSGWCFLGFCQVVAHYPK